jgi:hypothetical protein
MKVINFLLNNITYTYFGLSGASKYNDSTYNVYKRYIESKIDLTYDKYIIYDFKATGKTIKLINRVLIDNEIKQENIMHIYTNRNTLHIASNDVDRCVPYTDILSGVYQPINTSKMCNFIIFLLYKLTYNKLFS